MTAPTQYVYSKEHVWVKEENGQFRLGITQFAQSELGDIVFVELPEVGEMIQTGDSFGSLESVKTVSELYAPISGKVVEVNEELDDSPEYVNESPYEQAWMIIVEPSDRTEVQSLMSATDYDKMTSGE